MKSMTDKFRVTMDLAVKKALFDHMPHNIVNFKELKNNMYEMNPSDLTSYTTKKRNMKSSIYK